MGSGQGGYNLSNKFAQVDASGSFEIELPAANVVDDFVVEHGVNILMF